MLEIKDLSVKVSNKTILNNFNLKIKDNEIHCLMGQNGVGKSTICKVILGDENYKIKNGTINFFGKEINKLSITERARMGIYLINQTPIEIEGVSNALMLRTALSEITGEYVKIFEFNEELKRICKKLNIPEEFIHRGINEGMSGGERKKNELLHMWILKPKLILIDEIDSGLDIDSLKLVAKSIKEYLDTFKASLLIITHHEQILKYLKPNYVHILKDGQIVKTGDYKLASKIEKNGFINILKTNEVSENNKNE